MWKNIDKSRRGSAHYSIMSKNSAVTGMVALKAMFPNAEADELNFVLFSTSGVHGTYNTIEEAEKGLNGEVDEDGEVHSTDITFVIVHPRLVAMRYGICEPENQEDIDYLKKLRETSRKAVLEIGEYVTP